GALDRSLALFAEALGELGADTDSERRALLLEAKAAALIDVSRPDEATALLEQAASLLPEEPPTVARAIVLAALAARRAFSGEFERCRVASERAVAAARAAGAREPEANALIMLGSTHVYLEEGDGEALIQAAYEIAEADGSHRIALRALLGLSDVLELRGDHEQSAATAERGLALATRAGLTRNVYGVYLAHN